MNIEINDYPKKQNWIIEKNEKYPYVIFDNWFQKSELTKIWKQLNYFTDKDILPRASFINNLLAFDGNGNCLNDAYTMYFDTYFQDNTLQFNHLKNNIYKVQNPTFHDTLTNTSEVFNTFANTNHSAAFACYYENDNRYRYHVNNGLFTMLIWLYKEPKKFKGGDLIFKKEGKVISAKNNRMIIFPSYLEYKIDKIVMKKTTNNTGCYLINYLFGMMF